MDSTKKDLIWRKILGPEELPEGRVVTATCGHLSLCMTHHEGTYGALDNKCPHQGGPLGEGSIEKGLLRCPWHGWDFDPLTGKAPGFDDGIETFEVEVREDGVYVGLPNEEVHVRTVGDLMMETMNNWGVKHVFGMVGLQSGSGRRPAHSRRGREDQLHRRPPRRGRLLRVFGLR